MDITSISIASAFCIASIITIYYLYIYQFAKSKIPHATGGLPLIGHTYFLHSDPDIFMKRCRDKYGPLYTVDYLGKRIIIFGKELIDELSKNKNLEFTDALNDLLLVQDILGLTAYLHNPRLDAAKTIRSMITPFLKSYNTRIYDQIQLVESELFKCKDSVLVDSPPEIIRRMVVKASCNILLGDRLSKDEEIIDAFYNYPITAELSIFTKINYTKFPIIGRFYARYLINQEQVHLPFKILFAEKIAKEANTRMTEESNESYAKPNDLLQRMLDDNYTIEEITMMTMGLVFGSITTTTNNSTLTLYNMMTYPEYYDELYQEQLEVQKLYGDQLNSDVIGQMTKLNSFIRETMRLAIGGIANFRYSKEDWILSNGITIPKGSMLGVDTFSLHYDEKLQGGNAYEFLPFRHAEKGKTATKVEQQNISFGLGQHACPGRFMAIQEIMTILSFLIRHYKITTHDGKPHPYKVRPILFGLPKGEGLVFTKLKI